MPPASYIHWGILRNELSPVEKLSRQPKMEQAKVGEISTRNSGRQDRLRHRPWKVEWSMVGSMKTMVKMGKNMVNLAFTSSLVVKSFGTLSCSVTNTVRPSPQLDGSFSQGRLVFRMSFSLINFAIGCMCCTTSISSNPIGSSSPVL